MSAAAEQLPVFVIEGTNWRVEVEIDEFNSQFEEELQIEEACTRAVEAVKGLNPHKLEIIMDKGEEVPELGPTVIFWKKGEDPKVGNFSFTHVLLANGGFYKESMAMERVLQKEIEKIKQDELNSIEAQKKLDEQKKKDSDGNKS